MQIGPQFMARNASFLFDLDHPLRWNAWPTKDRRMRPPDCPGEPDYTTEASNSIAKGVIHAPLSNHSTFRVKRFVEGFDTCIVGMSDNAPMGHASSIGLRVQALREGKNLTQEELAAETGIGRSTIAGIESGRAMPGRVSLDALASYFGVTMDYLNTGATTPELPSPDRIIQKASEAKLLQLWRDLDGFEKERAIRVLQAFYGDAKDVS